MAEKVGSKMAPPPVEPEPDPEPEPPARSPSMMGGWEPSAPEEPAAAAATGARRRVTTAEEHLMERLDAEAEATKTGDRMFVRHRTLVWESPDILSVLVTPWYVVRLNQPTGHMEVVWLGEDGKTGGLTAVGDPIVLASSHGYKPECLPAFSHNGKEVLGVCDELSRITLWDPSSGRVVCSLAVTEDPLDPESCCLYEPSVFAISAEYVVVCKAVCDVTSAVYSIRWIDNPELGPVGVADRHFDKFVCALAHPRYGVVNKSYPFEFYITSDHGVGTLNLVIPAPMRAVIPALQWLKSTYVESGTADQVDTSTEHLQGIVARYTEMLSEWAMPDYRVTVDTEFSAGEWGFSTAAREVEGTGRVAEDHATIVMPLRTFMPPKVPEEYRCVHFSADRHILVGTAPNRITWNNRDINAFCPAKAVTNAIAAEAITGGMVVLTASLGLVFVEAPMVESRIVSTSTLLQLTHDREVREEMRATMRYKKDEDGNVVHRGAPLGTTLAVTASNHVVCHTFEHVVWVYTVEDYAFDHTDGLAAAISGLSIDKEATVDLVCPTEPTDDAAAAPRHRLPGGSLRTGPDIGSLWYQAADDAVGLEKKADDAVVAAVVATAIPPPAGFGAMDEDAAAPAPEEPGTVVVPTAGGDWLKLAEELAADGDSSTDDDEDNMAAASVGRTTSGVRWTVGDDDDGWGAAAAAAPPTPGRTASGWDASGIWAEARRETAPRRMLSTINDGALETTSAGPPPTDDWEEDPEIAVAMEAVSAAAAAPLEEWDLEAGGGGVE